MGEIVTALETTLNESQLSCIVCGTIVAGLNTAVHVYMRVHVRLQVIKHKCVCASDLSERKRQSLPQLSVLHHSQIKGKPQTRQDRGNKGDRWRDRRDREPFRGSHLWA